MSTIDQDNLNAERTEREEPVYEIKQRMRATTRYPFTYACDWIRESGIAESRSEASRWVADNYQKMGFAFSQHLVVMLAEQYIDHYAEIERLDKAKAAKMAFLVASK